MITVFAAKVPIPDASGVKSAFYPYLRVLGCLGYDVRLVVDVLRNFHVWF